MKKKKLNIKVESYGRYTKWNRGSRKLPKILEFTNIVEAIEGNEFGMILKITGGKGIQLDFCIKHPPFKDAKGIVEPDFTGQNFVNSNQYEFYIGDCIWLPVEDKVGLWEVMVFYDGELVANQKFNIVLPKKFGL